MKAKIGTIILVLLLGVICITPTTFAIDEVKIILNGETLTLDVPAQVIDGRTLVPARAILEGLGMTVTWNDDKQIVTAIKKGVSIIIPIDNTTVIRNMTEHTIDVPAQIINEKTFVPVRFVSEFAGATVEWIESTQTVNIKSNDSIKQLDWNDECYYCGEVKDSIPKGYGIVYNKNTDEVVEAGLYDNFMLVEGALFNDDEEVVYIGKFENGKASNGISYMSDGSYYEGSFKDGLWHGNGMIYDAANNSYFLGYFENNTLNGIYTVFDANNDTSYEVIYENGIYLGTIPKQDDDSNTQETNTQDANTQDANYNICLVSNCHQRPRFGSDYCSNHSCRKCNNIRANNFSLYCENHMCISSNCSSSRTLNSMYCSSHKCLSPSCPEKKTSIASNYCKNHECIVVNCTLNRVFNTQYCIRHKK